MNAFNKKSSKQIKHPAKAAADGIGLRLSIVSPGLFFSRYLFKFDLPLIHRKLIGSSFSKTLPMA